MQDLNQVLKTRLQQKLNAKVLVNEPLHKYSSIKLGGPADLFVSVTVLEDIATCINFCRENNLDYYILGGGTNTLISDSGFRGLVIRNNVVGLEVKGQTDMSFDDTMRGRKEESNWQSDFLSLEGIEPLISDKGVRVELLAGTPLAYSISSCIESDATGLEVFAGIPGTIGGAVWNNIHGANLLFGQFVESVSVLTSEGAIKSMHRSELEFSYNHSIFHATKDIILSATLVLFSGGKGHARQVANEWISRKIIQPKNSLGSIFSNLTEEQKASAGLENLSTGFVIDKVLNLKGYSIGGAQIAPNHANFIITHVGCTAKDYLTLIEYIKTTAKEKLNIDLQEEIVKLGEF